MTISEAIVRVQEAYPRIYLACHSRHHNSRTTAPRLSQRDSSILSHLNETTPVAQSDLARHLFGSGSAGEVAPIHRTLHGNGDVPQLGIPQRDELRRFLQS